MTSIQSQLATLKADHRIFKGENSRPASIFSTNAESVSISSLFEAACSVLDQLAQYEPRFHSFRQNLFSASLIDYQRSLKTKQEILNLDNEIERFLDLLSLWLADPNSHILLEFLIRQFNVHLYNMDCLLRCVIVVHETKLFVQVTRLCSLDKTPWIFLSGVRESGICCPRSLITTQCIKSVWLLDLLTNLVVKKLKLVGVFEKCTSFPVARLAMDSVSNILSLHVAVLVEVSEKVVLDELHMRVILKPIFESFQNVEYKKNCLKFVQDWQSSSCIILSQVCRKVTFENDILSSLCFSMVRCIFFWETEQCSSIIMQQIVLTLIVMAQHDQFVVSPQLCGLLISGEADKVSIFVKILVELRSNNSSHLATSICLSIYDKLLNNSSKSDVRMLELIDCFVGSKLLQVDGMEQLFCFLKAYSTQQNQSLIRKIFVSLFTAMPSTVSAYLSTNSNGLDDVLQLYDSFLIDKNLSNEEVYYLKLLHPLKCKRIEGINQVAKLTETAITDRTPIFQLLENFLDDVDTDIAGASWNMNIITKLVHHHSPQELEKLLRRSVVCWTTRLEKSLSQQTLAILSKIFVVLESFEVQGVLTKDGSKESCIWFVGCLLPFMVEGEYFKMNKDSLMQIEKFKASSKFIFSRLATTLEVVSFVDELAETNFSKKDRFHHNFPVSRGIMEELTLLIQFSSHLNSALILNALFKLYIYVLVSLLKQHKQHDFASMMEELFTLLKCNGKFGLFSSTIDCFHRFFLNLRAVSFPEFSQKMNFNDSVMQCFKFVEKHEIQYALFSSFVCTGNRQLFDAFQDALVLFYSNAFGGALCRIVLSYGITNFENCMCTVGYEGLIAVLDKLNSESPEIDKSLVAVCVPLVILGCNSPLEIIRSYSVVICEKLLNIDDEVYIKFNKSPSESVLMQVNQFWDFFRSIVDNKHLILSDPISIKYVVATKCNATIKDLLIQTIISLEWTRPSDSIILLGTLQECSNLNHFECAGLLHLFENFPSVAESSTDSQLNLLLNLLVKSCIDLPITSQTNLIEMSYKFLKLSLEKKNSVLFCALIKDLFSAQALSTAIANVKVKVWKLCFQFYFNFEQDYLTFETVLSFCGSLSELAEYFVSFLSCGPHLNSTLIKIAVVCDSIHAERKSSALFFGILMDTLSMSVTRTCSEFCFQNNPNFYESLLAATGKFALNLECADQVVLKKRCETDFLVLLDTLTKFDTLASNSQSLRIVRRLLNIFPSFWNFVIQSIAKSFCNGSAKLLAIQDVASLFLEYKNQADYGLKDSISVEKFFMEYTIHVLMDFSSSQHFEVISSLLLQLEDNNLRAVVIFTILCASFESDAIYYNTMRKTDCFVPSGNLKQNFTLSIELMPILDVRTQVCLLNEVLSSAKSTVRKVFEENLMNPGCYLLDLFSTCYISNCNSFKRFFAATVLRFLEFVGTVMESKLFRKSNFDILNSRTVYDGVHFQNEYLLVGDLTLNIIILLEKYRRKPQHLANKEICISHGDVHGNIGLKSLVDIYLNATSIVFNNLQKLLDSASFYSILQTLMDHKLLHVRQKAISLLRDRLQCCTASTMTNDVPFVVDLSSRLQKIFTEFATNQILCNDESSFEGNCAFAQSALMCLDTLVQSIGPQKSFHGTLLKIFSGVVELISSLQIRLYNDELLFQRASMQDLKKLLAALIIFASSICRSLKLSCVPYFQNFMLSLKIIFTCEIDLWSKRCYNPPKSGIDTFDIRPQILFIRSIISAYAILIDSLSSVVHNHLGEVFGTFFKAYERVESISHRHSEIKEVRGDIDRCFAVICRKIPSRILLLHIQTHFRSIVSDDKRASRRLASLVNDTVRVTERVDLILNLNEWLQVALSLLGYRHEDVHSSLADTELENNCCELLVDIGLKLTENELISFLLRIIEWTKSADSKENVIRSSNFYLTIRALLAKLKHLSQPYLALIWDNLVLDYGMFSGTTEHWNVNKKRKHSTCLEDTPAIQSMTILNQRMLISLRQCCDFCPTGFINEDRFNIIFPVLLRLVDSKDTWYVDGIDAFLKTVQDFIAPIICKLCLLINNDVLWKPLNHQLLMMTRNSNSTVKMATLEILKLLFTEVGVDYLQLLPESLPFISELMEDSDRRVLKVVNETISVIEEISGESFDSLLS